MDTPTGNQAPPPSDPPRVSGLDSFSVVTDDLDGVPAALQNPGALTEFEEPPG